MFLSRRTTAVTGRGPEGVYKLLAELGKADLARMYAIGDQRFVYLPRFGNYPRAKKPKWPLPPDEIGGNEIKDLQQKRCANANRCTTNVPETETETETETDKRNTPPPKGVRALLGLDLLLKAGVDEQVAKDWLSLRRVKKLPLTQTAMAGIEAEAKLAKLTVPQVVKEAIERGWGSFKAVWLERDAFGTKVQPTASGAKAVADTEAYLKSMILTDEEKERSAAARKKAMAQLRKEKS
jgi:hypothetical protein